MPMLVRFNADGTRDSGYGASGVADATSVSNMWIEDMDFTPDGKVLAALGVNGTVNFRAMRVAADGFLDLPFGGSSTGIATYSSNDVTATLSRSCPMAAFSSRVRMSAAARSFARRRTVSSTPHSARPVSRCLTSVPVRPS